MTWHTKRGEGLEWRRHRIDRSDPEGQARLLDRKAEIFDQLAAQDPDRAGYAYDGARASRERASELRRGDRL